MVRQLRRGVRIGFVGVGVGVLDQRR